MEVIVVTRRAIEHIQADFLQFEEKFRELTWHVGEEHLERAQSDIRSLAGLVEHIKARMGEMQDEATDAAHGAETYTTPTGRVGSEQNTEVGGKQDEMPMTEQMRDMNERLHEMELHLSRFVTKSGIYARMIPLFLLIFAVIVYPFYGMATHMPPESLAQYMAPVTGLAGAIIGYWFGQAGSAGENRS